MATLSAKFGLLVAAAGLAAGAEHACAQFAVNVFFDAPAVNPAVGCDADAASPGNQCTLRSVIQHINTLPAGNYTITIPSGFYLLSFAGHGEDAGVRGDLDVYRNIAIRGGGLGSTFIDAQVLGDRIFDVRAGVTLTLEDLGLYNGTAVPGVFGVETGGAIRAVAGSTVNLHRVEVSMCSASGGLGAHGGAIDAQGDLNVIGWGDFFGNSASGHGGAVYLGGSGTFVDVWFDGNQSAREGGAIRSTPSSANLRVLRGRQQGNMAQAAGGAINTRSGSTSIDGVVFENNSAVGVGGAINAFGVLRMDGARLVFNHSSSGGGGLNVAGLGSAEIVDTIFEGNNALTSGGAITNSSSCIVRHSSFIANGAHGDWALELGGGAIYNFGHLVLVNSTLSGNLAPIGLGGALLNLTGGLTEMAHVTIAFNDAPLPGAGRAIHNGTPSGGAVLRSTHSIVFSLPGGGPSVAGVSLPLASLGYNLDADGSAGFGFVGDIAGTLFAPVDPMLTPMGSWGGPTPMHGIAAPSPCRDAGNAAFSVDPFGVAVLFDQRYETRPIGIRPDIGAFEWSCKADWNGDGALDFFDMLAFLSDWANGNMAADCNGDGVLDFFDVLEFLNALAVGCP